MLNSTCSELLVPSNLSEPQPLPSLLMTTPWIHFWLASLSHIFYPICPESCCVYLQTMSKIWPLLTSSFPVVLIQITVLFNMDGTMASQLVSLLFALVFLLPLCLILSTYVPEAPFYSHPHHSSPSHAWSLNSRIIIICIASEWGKQCSKWLLPPPGFSILSTAARMMLLTQIGSLLYSKPCNMSPDYSVKAEVLTIIYKAF